MRSQGYDVEDGGCSGWAVEDGGCSGWAVGALLALLAAAALLFFQY